MFDIAIKKTITQENIDDILATALEGGINYWAVSARPKDKDYKGADYGHEVVSRGGILIIATEEGEKHELNLENLTKGFQLFADSNSNIDFMEDYDAVTADCIVQLALFGEIVYG